MSLSGAYFYALVKTKTQADGSVPSVSDGDGSGDGTMPRNFCADPFQRHKTKLYKQLWPVSELMINEVNDPRLKEGDFLCIQCKIKLTQDPKSLPPKNPDNSSSSSAQADTDSLPDDQSGPSAETSFSDQDTSRDVTEKVLPLIGVSPLTTSKWILCLLYILQCLLFLLSYVFRCLNVNIGMIHERNTRPPPQDIFS